MDDDLVGKLKLSGVYFMNSPDYLVSAIEPKDIKEYFEKTSQNTNENASPAWIKQMKTIKDEDNSILVLMKI